MWNKLNDYCLQNGTNTIAKAKIGDETIYNLYYNGKGHYGFATAKAAMDEFDALETEKRLEIIARNGATGDHYE